MKIGPATGPGRRLSGPGHPLLRSSRRIL